MGAVRGARAAPRGDGRLSEPREPLWAEGLARRPLPPDEDDYFPPPPAPARPEPAPEASPVAALLAVMAVLAIAFWAAILSGGSIFTQRTVLSAWEDVPMRCQTLRVDRGPRAAERFRCRALDGGRLPPGVYTSPDATWRSDLTGESARGDVIRISPDGVLVGVALY